MLREEALAASTNGLMIIDMAGADAVFEYVNPAFESITGYASSEILGRNPRLLQRNDTSQPGLTALRMAIKAQQGCHVRLRNYRKDGSLFWNDLKISPVFQPAPPVADALLQAPTDRNNGVVERRLTHYIGVQTDISEYVLAQDALRVRTERLHAVFDLSPDGFIVLDEDEFVSIVNPAFERLTGLDASNLIGRHRQVLESLLRRRCLPEAGGPDKPPRPAFVDTQPFDGESAAPVSTTEVLRLMPPHSRTLLRRVRRSRQGVRDTVLYFRDITREAEIDRMKSEFLSTAAHELRTPMTSIFGFTELLLRRHFDEVRRQEIIATVHRQAGLLVNLVNELLDLARIESRRGSTFKREVQPLQPIIAGAIESLMMTHDPRTVTMTARDQEVLVDIDPEKLTLALTNVLSNAYKYSPGGGEIDIELLDRRRNDCREIGIQIRDRGMGMTSEHVERVFERFFRADSSGSIPGTGLGMSIAKEVVELQGGEVTVASQPGSGTRVTIWLPVCGPGEFNSS